MDKIETIEVPVEQVNDQGEIIESNKIVLKAIPVESDKDPRGISRKIPEDLFKDDYNTGVIEPPFDLFTLSTMPESSSILGPCIDAMAINIEKLGHRVVPRDSIKKEDESIKPEIQEELSIVSTFFDNATLEYTFKVFRERLRRDFETTGNSYHEVLTSFVNPTIPAGLEHLPSWTMRLYRMDEEPTYYEVPRAIRVGEKWEIKQFPHRKYFRRYVQRKQSGSDKVFFKEWGDPRVIDYKTGDVLADTWEVASDDQRKLAANQVIHRKLYSSRSPYGLPRFIGNLFKIYGNRAAETINYTTLKCNNIPAMMMLATNAQLSKGSIARIKEFVEERIQGDNNYSTILIIEAEPITEGMKDPGTMKLELKPLTDTQHTDAMFINYTDKNDESIRQSYRMPPIFLGRADEYNRACYSSDTETLTEFGWKLHWEISPDEKIAAFNPVDNSIEFVIPEKKFVYDVENESMYHFHNKTTDCFVTGDHKMLGKPATRKEDVWDEFKAGTLRYPRFAVPMAASKWDGNEIDYFELPKVDECQLERGYSHKDKIPGDDWLEFLGYFISEGGILITSYYTAPYYVGIAQKHPEKKLKIRACLDRLSWNFSESISSDGTSRFLISNRCLRDWIFNNVGTHAQDKIIPWEYLNLTVRQLSILFEAMMLGDGTQSQDYPRTSNRSYCTSSYVLAGQVQRLLIQIGCRAIVEPGTRSYRVSFTDRKETVLCEVGQHRTPPSITVEKYTGEVYCYSVPSHGFFVTRRDGKIAIQGNTSDASRKLAEEQIFKPERDDVDDDYNTTIVPALGAASVLYRSNTPNVTDNYELTQLLAVAERSGGLSPHISRIVVEDVLGKDLPEVDSSINPQLPFTLTMLRESLMYETDESGETTKIHSEEDVVKQLHMLRSMAVQSDGVSNEVVKSLDNLIAVMEIGQSEEVRAKSRPKKQTEEQSQKGLIEFKPIIKSEDSEDMIIGGAVLVPGVIDLQGETYDDIATEGAAYFWFENYLEDPKENGIKLMHEGEIIYDALRPIQSYVLDRETTFQVDVSAADESHPSKELTEITYPKGTWMLFARFRDKALWEDHKEGKYLGWSIGGIALVQQLKQYMKRILGKKNLSQ